MSILDPLSYLDVIRSGNTTGELVHYHRGNVLGRPVENCTFVNPDDGTCAHPLAATPECWQDGPDRSDCPLRP